MHYSPDDTIDAFISRHCPLRCPVERALSRICGY